MDNEQPPTSFAELMALKRIDAPTANADPEAPEKIERFESIALPYAPGLGARAFGGHVYAQSAYAASHTVAKGFVIHNVTGTFILPGLTEAPYVYTVRHLRDGAMYCTRAVDARQEGQICFSSICCFKRDEKQDPFNHHAPSAQERYRSILAARPPEEQPLSPSVDADWWIDHVNDSSIFEPEFPGLDVRKIDMMNYNLQPEVKQSPENYRQLTWYKLKGSPGDDVGNKMTTEELREKDESGEFDNLYACAHMYSSDKNSLLLIPRALGIKYWTSMASLTLTVVFHQHGDALRMIDWGNDRNRHRDHHTNDAHTTKPKELGKKWFIQEGWTPRSGENRAVHESWLWSPDGKLIATSYQDSMLRLNGLGKL